MTAKRNKKVAHPSPRPITVSKLPPALPASRNLWLFRLLAGIIIPLLFFAALEAGLKIWGYGY